MTSSVEQIREMIPLYLNGSLSEQQADAFRQDIKKHPELQQELQEFTDINETFESFQSPDDKQFDSLFNQIENQIARDTPTKVTIPEQNDSLLDKLRDLFLNPFVSWGVALAQFALVALILFNTGPQKTDVRYQSLSHTGQVHTGSINIVFAQEATVEQINSLLLQHRLDIVSGPNRSNVYLVRAQGSTETESLLDQLRLSTIIRLAEKTLTE